MNYNVSLSPYEICNLVNCKFHYVNMKPAKIRINKKIVVRIIRISFKKKTKKINV